MLYCEQNDVSDLKKNKILIIEDSEFVNKTIYSLLNKQDYYILEQAFDFEQANIKLEKNKYDFIILDLNLPDAYGDELVKKIKNLSDAKIVILTAEADKQIRESLFQNAILDYIVKDKNFSKSLKSLDNTIRTISKNIHTNILIIDDSTFMCKQIEKILNVRNYNSFIAMTAKGGLEILNTQKVNLIVLDMELPDKHGLEFLGEIRQNDKFNHIPVIILSGNNDPELIKDCLKTGASDFITKPFNIEEFTLKVDLSTEANRTYTEMLCKQKLLDEYKMAVDDSTIVSKTDIKGIITYVNDKFCKISGYTSKELIGKPHNIVRHPDMLSTVFKEMWETIQNKKPWSGIVKNLKKDGSTYYVQSTINPVVDYDGEIVEYIGIRTDVTELEAYRKILEENLNISNNNLQYLKQYEDAMDEFVSVIKTNPKGTITYVNENFCKLSGFLHNELLGRKYKELRAKKHIQRGDCDNIAKKLQNNKKISILFENITKDNKTYFVDTKIFPLMDNYGNIVEHLHLMYDVTEIVHMHKELESTQKEIIYKMGEIGESRSKETGNHVKRVAQYSKLLALLAGLGEKNANLLYSASPMHDIGKVAIPDSILKKPEKLSEKEWVVMRSHSEIGYNILKNSKRSILRAAAIISYRHHEKWDGTGYPNGLKGKDIHIFGRITAIADVFDALGSDRCYKKAWDLEKILNLFEEEKGKQFDPKLVEIFLNNIDKFLLIRDKFKD